MFGCSRKKLEAVSTPAAAPLVASLTPFARQSIGHARQQYEALLIEDRFRVERALEEVPGGREPPLP